MTESKLKLGVRASNSWSRSSSSYDFDHHGLLSLWSEAQVKLWYGSS